MCLQQKNPQIYRQQNPGVVTAHDPVALGCSCQEKPSGGIVHLARAGCARPASPARC